MSSFMAMFVDKLFKKDDVLSYVTASETSNNSANISVLIPLLLLGIAIIPSEYILLSILEVNGLNVTWEQLSYSFNSILWFLLISNFISFVFAWNLFKYILIFIKYTSKYLVSIFLIVSFYTVYNIGSIYSQEIYYIIVMLIFSTIGLFFRKIDYIPFIFTFLIQQHTEIIIQQYIDIYL
jgi:TctA family transporter